MKIHKYDTVIVGAGGAGMRAAIEATKRSRTAVLTKLYPTRSHTGAAQGGMAAALANVEEDNWEWHTFDTVKGGDYLVDQDAAEILAKEAIDSVLDLEKIIDTLLGRTDPSSRTAADASESAQPSPSPSAKSNSSSASAPHK